VKKSLLDRYVSNKFMVGMAIEFPILVIGGILGLVFSWLQFPGFPIPNIVGLVLIIAGYVIHLGYAHKEFGKTKVKTHRCSEAPEELVTSGIYSRIRHPGYLGLILIYFGLALIFGVVWMLIPAFVFSVLTYLTAVKEELSLKKQFGSAYEEYMKRVPWRFIPKIV
jgi:protein-S-isoprenylcysteine O-methyltransferase Ste14